jgi:hypothetical protein
MLSLTLSWTGVRVPPPPPMLCSETDSLKPDGLTKGREWLFWDCEPGSLDLHKHRDFLIRRVLESGDWSAIQWIRGAMGDAAIREWFLSKNGGRLDPRRLRFWGLILDVPVSRVDEWVEKAKLSHWRERPSA